MGETIKQLGEGALIIYFLPTLFAFLRRHKSLGGVLAINVLLGLTIIGWIIALAWSLSDTGRRPQPSEKQTKDAQQTIIFVQQMAGSYPPILKEATIKEPPIVSDPQWPKIKKSVSLQLVRAAEHGARFYESSVARFGRENVLAFAAIAGLSMIVGALVLLR